MSPWLASTSRTAATQTRSTLPLMLYLPGVLTACDPELLPAGAAASTLYRVMLRCKCHEPCPAVGIDGTGLAAFKQFPAIVEHFDLRALFIPSADRTPFPELVDLTACADSPAHCHRPQHDCRLRPGLAIGSWQNMLLLHRVSWTTVLLSARQ